MIRRLVLSILLLLRHEDILLGRILSVCRTLRFDAVKHRWRYLAEPLSGIPHTEHDVEHLAVNDPWRGAQHVETSKDKLNVSL
jgi:hypothetical protein